MPKKERRRTLFDHRLRWWITLWRAANQLCGLYTALARLIINHYGDDASIEEAKCLKQGDSECEIRIRWAA